MKSFRLAVDASVCVTVEAETFEEAEAVIRQALISVCEGVSIRGCFELPENGAESDEMLYFDESATNNIHLEDVEDLDPEEGTINANKEEPGGADEEIPATP